MIYQIKIKTFEKRLIPVCIVDLRYTFGACKNITMSKRSTTHWSLLRSPHANKNSQEQFKKTLYTAAFHINGTMADRALIVSLMQRYMELNPKIFITINIQFKSHF